MAQHRRIDAFTDTHPAFARSRSRLHRLAQDPVHRRFTGVAIDILYDHLLAQDWPQHHPDPLPVYAESVFHRLLTEPQSIPPRPAQALARMQHEHWLEDYATRPGLRRALGRFSRYLTRRFDHPLDLTPAVDDLADDPDHFRDDFAVFFPQLRRYAQQP